MADNVQIYVDIRVGRTHSCKLCIFLRGILSLYGVGVGKGKSDTCTNMGVHCSIQKTLVLNLEDQHEHRLGKFSIIKLWKYTI